MDDNARLQLQKMIKANDVEDQTGLIRELKHSETLRNDVKALDKQRKSMGYEMKDTDKIGLFIDGDNATVEKLTKSYQSQHVMAWLISGKHMETGRMRQILVK